MKKFRREEPIWARNPLSDELRKYGFVFSLKKGFLLYLLVVTGLILLGRFFRLGMVCQTILCIVVVLMVPLFLRNMLKGRFLQRRFSDLNIYMEQYLYSFQKTGKILKTLEEVQLLFESGEMRNTIGDAIEHISNTFNEADVELHGLEMIEEEYGYTGLVTMHRFSLQVEKDGGDYHRSIMLLLEARRMWADRIYALLKEKRRRRVEIFLSIATSLLLCSLIYLMADDLDIDIASHPLAQGITLIVLVLDLFIFYAADKKLSLDYMKEQGESDEDIEKIWKRFYKYKDSKHLTDRMGYNILKKKISREIEKRFPQWLMEVSLLLQSENVQVAIFKSYESAPEVIKPSLRKMILSLQQNPASMKPYLEFLQEFVLPEVRSTMKMLYSISEGNGGDADDQIQDMIRRNQVMIDKAERLKNEDRMAGMYALFLAPQMTAGAKLLVDMILLLAVYMSQMAESLMQ